MARVERRVHQDQEVGSPYRRLRKSDAAGVKGRSAGKEAFPGSVVTRSVILYIGEPTASGSGVEKFV